MTNFYRNFCLFVDGDGAVDGNWWDSKVKVATAKENGSQEKGQLTITKMRSVHKQRKKIWKILKKTLKGKSKATIAKMRSVQKLKKDKFGK